MMMMLTMREERKTVQMIMNHNNSTKNGREKISRSFVILFFEQQDTVAVIFVCNIRRQKSAAGLRKIDSWVQS